MRDMMGSQVRGMTVSSNFDLSVMEESSTSALQSFSILNIYVVIISLALIGPQDDIRIIIPIMFWKIVQITFFRNRVSVFNII